MSPLTTEHCDMFLIEKEFVDVLVLMRMMNDILPTTSVRLRLVKVALRPCDVRAKIHVKGAAATFAT